MNFNLYSSRFSAQKEALVFPADCEIQEPLLRRTSDRNWTLDWVLTFKDGKYVRIHEHYGKHHSYFGVRTQFAFHYGQIIRRDDSGRIQYDRADDVDIRIDSFPAPVHLHFGSPEPHHGQENIEGLNLEGMTVFHFLETILEHRCSGRPLDVCFGFTIVVAG